MPLMRLSTVCPNVTVCQITLFSNRPYTSSDGSKGHVSTIYLLADRKTGQGRGDEGGAETVL